MGEAGGFLGVVLAADAHRDEGLDAGLFLVYGHVNLKTVVKSVDFGMHRVAGYFFVFTAGGEGQNSHCCG